MRKKTADRWKVRTARGVTEPRYNRAQARLTAKAVATPGGANETAVAVSIVTDEAWAFIPDPTYKLGWAEIERPKGEDLETWIRARLNERRAVIDQDDRYWTVCDGRAHHHVTKPGKKGRPHKRSVRRLGDCPAGCENHLKVVGGTRPL